VNNSYLQYTAYRSTISMYMLASNMYTSRQPYREI